MNILRANGTAIIGHQFNDACSFFLHRLQSRFAQHDHARFRGHLVKHLFGDVRFDRVSTAGGRSAATLERLVPVERLAIAGDQSREIFPSDAADTARIADVHGAQSAGGHPAQMPARFDQCDSFPHPCRLHGRDHSARRAAIDAHICFDNGHGVVDRIVARLVEVLGEDRVHGQVVVEVHESLLRRPVRPPSVLRRNSTSIGPQSPESLLGLAIGHGAALVTTIPGCGRHRAGHEEIDLLG